MFRIIRIFLFVKYPYPGYEITFGFIITSKPHGAELFHENNDRVRIAARNGGARYRGQIEIMLEFEQGELSTEELVALLTKLSNEYQAVECFKA